MREEDSGHPRVFLTLAAPSFGAVHAHRAKAGKTQPCRPHRDDPMCPHGRPERCRATHQADAPQAGQPICVDCYENPPPCCGTPAPPTCGDASPSPCQG
ncbi:replication initiator [Spirillospora sp. CA-128828]|uniref:replication initiator n=1 Tax=Spirillospora sp. CA-128828 TaxID=3240033 RepID=UPI003D8C99FC